MPAYVPSTASVNLGRLLGVRLVLLAVLTLLLLFARATLDLPLPVVPVAVVLGTWAAITLASWLRFKGQGGRTGEEAIAAQLAVDLAGLTAVLYLSGGWTNPLVSLYLVPIAVAAATVSARLTWLLAAAATLAYSAMALVYQPVMPLHGDDSGFAVHVAGMWLTFVVSAGLVAYFGTTMAAALRNRERALAKAREGNLRNEQIMGVATLAAGTAHELSTPLASIAVIASELEAASEGETRQDLQRLLQQVNVCRDALERLRSAAEPSHEIVTTAELLRQVCQRFSLLRPAVPLACAIPDEPTPRLEVDETLKQALLNLLDNAANASPESVTLTCRWNDGGVEIDVLDRGPGFPDGAAPPSRGLGVGLVLANATIERLGGTVYASSREGDLTGSRVRVRLPVVDGDRGKR